LIIFLVFLIVFAFIACKDVSSVSNLKPAVLKAAPTPSPEPKYSLSFSAPDIYGCARAIVSADLIINDSSGFSPDAYGFAVSDENGPEVFYENADKIDNTLYAAFTGLKPDKKYLLRVFITLKGKRVYLDETVTFLTPKRTTSIDDIEKYIYDELTEKKVDEENRLLLETQASLALLGMESGRFGKFDPLTQANLCRLEYSLNAKDSWVNYDDITGLPNETTLDALKDILSADILITGKDIVHPFTPTPYFLTRYAYISDEGGGLNIEQYLYEKIIEDEEILKIYQDYPYDKQTDAFKTKYQNIINSPDLSDEAREKKLNGISAKNKARFSNSARVWLTETAKPLERLVTLAGTDNELTINALVAYAYLYVDGYRDIGKRFKTSTTYRTYAFQWDLYSQGAGRSVSSSRNESWHLDRQRLSYVPGFSNHQYGVAIDFYERTTFGDSALYQYIKQNGAAYGFYNYYIEPWHWVYLGFTK